MSIEKYVKRERHARYKNLRKVRKARDMASAAIKIKKVPWKVSRVLSRFHADINSYTTIDLAYMIYRHMPKHLNPPLPPVRKK